MKTSVRGLAAGLAAMAALAAAAGAAEITGDVSVWSKYLWRGQVYTDDPVVQPSLDVLTDCGVGFNVWMNIDLTDVNEGPEDKTRGRPSEVDVTLYYGLPLEGALQAEIGAATYVISEPAAASGSTADAYVRVELDPAAAGEDSWAALLPTPSVALYYEFLEIRDIYLLFGLDSSFDLTETVSLDVGASIGYGSKDYNAFFFDLGGGIAFAESLPGDAAAAAAQCIPCGRPPQPQVDESAFNDFTVSAELGWQATDTLRLALMGQYTVMVENPVKSAADELFGDDEWVLGGVKASWSF